MRKMKWAVVPVAAAVLLVAAGCGSSSSSDSSSSSAPSGSSTSSTTNVLVGAGSTLIPPELEAAIRGLGLRGLKLSPPTQEFFPHDREKAYPIYEAAQALGIPVVIHCGMSWEPKAKASWAQPLFLEDVACDFPKLNIVIAHMGWPWVLDSVMLALKYPNIHLDTAALYFDNPWDFIAFMMSKQVPLTVFERSLRHQVVFGSNYPRVEIKNMVHAVKKLGLSEDCQHLIFQENGEKLIGERAA